MSKIDSVILIINIMESLPKEILNQILVVHSTYRMQCTLVSVCRNWQILILDLNIPVSDLTDIIYEFCIRLSRLSTLRVFEMRQLLIDAARPEYRILFIRSSFHKERRHIIARCAEYYDLYKYLYEGRIVDSVLTAVTPLCNRIDDVSILLNYWARIRKRTIRDNINIDSDIDYTIMDNIFSI